ncbi:GNAT family N-acetyltransferase [Arthrobacter gengyunqii]|uniref:GNAT family N-acetyltransferase n=1 Tax=Arthrobacter gengyunqii TaxID=2886940 RepID=A0A9X1M2C2_9MICC|nr:GNAT family N-acetyltransferase [Arthrobacter gengyunqii]MCC3269716.1 GNAT family N-acetyltransferase [Arthrobacter gengyunqii]UOY97171.1 GNAT family N-acetyltransferase [Arthrobacter gengyunqii]
MSITVRQATEADFDDIRRITRDAYVSGGFLEADNPYVKELENVEDRAANALVWVAELDGKVAASTAITFAGQPYTDIAIEGELEFRMLAVDPALQRGGVGRALVAAVIEYARSLEGIHAVSLTSMTPMTNAHALYKSMGFERVPERDWTVPEEDILLWVFRLAL